MGDDGGESSAGDGAETGEIELDMGLDEPERPDLSCEGAPPCVLPPEGRFFERPSENVEPFQTLPVEGELWLARWNMFDDLNPDNPDGPDYIGVVDVCSGDAFDWLDVYDSQGHDYFEPFFAEPERPLLVPTSAGLLQRQFNGHWLDVVRRDWATGGIGDTFNPADVSFGMRVTADESLLVMTAESGIVTIDLAGGGDAEMAWVQPDPAKRMGRTLAVADGHVYFPRYEPETRAMELLELDLEEGTVQVISTEQIVRWVVDFVSDDQAVYWLTSNSEGDYASDAWGSLWRYEPGSRILTSLGSTPAAPTFLAEAGDHLYYGTYAGELMVLPKYSALDEPPQQRLTASDQLEWIYDGAADCSGLYVHGKLASPDDWLQGVLALPLLEHGDG